MFTIVGTLLPNIVTPENEHLKKKKKLYCFQLCGIAFSSSSIAVLNGLL